MPYPLPLTLVRLAGSSTRRSMLGHRAAALRGRKTSSPCTSIRTFTTSMRIMASKEDKLHTEGRADEIERHKQDSLNKQKEGKAEWKDELASSSESAIKADRGEIDASVDTIKALQEESIKAAKEGSK